MIPPSLRSIAPCPGHRFEFATIERVALLPSS